MMTHALLAYTYVNSRASAASDSSTAESPGVLLERIKLHHDIPCSELTLQAVVGSGAEGKVCM